MSLLYGMCLNLTSASFSGFSSVMFVGWVGGFFVAVAA